MIKKYILRQSGLTLIELLAVLAISTMIIGLLSTALITAIKHNNVTQSHIDLRQEANLIVTKLRSTHQGENYKLCYENGAIFTDQNKTNSLASEKIILKGTDNALLQNENGSELTASASCAEFDPSKPLLVTLTLVDENAKEFQIDTVIDRLAAYNPDNDAPNNPIPEPIPEEDFYSYLKSNNVFVHGSQLYLSGGNKDRDTIKGGENGIGTVLIDNYNKDNLVFDGNNQISVKNVFIDKQGSKVIFNSSTALGTSNLTEIIGIKGTVDLNNGGAEINGNIIYIDGNVNFIDSAKINGKKIFISGDVNFKNWSAQLKADEIYIGGTISLIHPGNIDGTQKNGGNIIIPNHPKLKIPSLQEVNWHGYTSNQTLKDNMKYFGPSLTFKDWGNNNFKNVFIASDSNITLDGNVHVTGILFAPNGKVEINGSSTFKGIILAGKTSVTGSAQVIFDMSMNEDDLPF